MCLVRLVCENYDHNTLHNTLAVRKDPLIFDRVDSTRLNMRWGPLRRRGTPINNRYIRRSLSDYEPREKIKVFKRSAESFEGLPYF